MKLLEWRDDFSVGIDAVDYEHKELIALINTTLMNISQSKSHVSCLDDLGEIYAKISLHFALEEKVMGELEYDQFEDHKEDHERLLDSIRDIMDEYMDAPVLDEEKFGHHLEEWFIQHFSTKDARLHNFLQQ